MVTSNFMLLKFHYVGNTAVGYRVKITTEDNSVVLNWCQLQESHPLCRQIIELGPNTGDRVSFWSEVDVDEFVALGIADLSQQQLQS